MFAIITGNNFVTKLKKSVIYNLNNNVTQTIVLKVR
jgi:hypothetical protein